MTRPTGQIVLSNRIEIKGALRDPSATMHAISSHHAIEWRSNRSVRRVSPLSQRSPFLLPVKIHHGDCDTTLRQISNNCFVDTVCGYRQTHAAIGEAARSEQVIYNPYTLCCSSEKRTQSRPRCCRLIVFWRISSPRPLSLILGFELFVRNV